MKLWKNIDPVKPRRVDKRKVAQDESHNQNIALKITEEERMWLEEQAAKDFCSMSSIIRRSIDRYRQSLQDAE